MASVCGKFIRETIIKFYQNNTSFLEGRTKNLACFFPETWCYYDFFYSFG